MIGGERNTGDAMTEKEKMLAGALYDAFDPELVAERRHAQRLLARYNATGPDEGQTRATLLRELLGAVTKANRERATKPGKRRVPILLKIAPDLTWPQIDAVLGVIAEYGLDGIIATNTTLARPGYFATVAEAGGLSGAPVRRRATEIVNYLARATGGRLPIIGVGGITDIAGAAEKLDAGATLVQVYTGMIYRGPFFAAEVARALAERQRVGRG